MAKGPTPDLVIAYQGQGEGPSIFLSGIEYVFAKTLDPVVVEMCVPLSIKANWLRHFAFANTSHMMKKSDSLYYEKQSSQYAVWSFPLHVNQVRTILKTFPSNTLIVAPADGVGLIAKTWTGPVMSGDRVVDSLSDKLVVKETIDDTLGRYRDLLKDEVPKAIVLSYATAFLSDVNYAFLSSRTDPVYFLDVKAPPVQGLLKLGHGVWALRPFSIALIDTQPEISVLKYVTFTENLLRETGYRVYREGPHYQYFRAMRPFARLEWVSGTPLPSGNGQASLTLIESTLDLIEFEKYDLWRSPIYFAPLGMRLEGFSQCTERELNFVDPFVELVAKKVYEIPDDSFLSQVVRSYLPFVAQSKKVYFFSSVVDNIKFSHRSDRSGSTMVVQGILSFVPQPGALVSGGLMSDGSLCISVGVLRPQEIVVPIPVYVPSDVGASWRKWMKMVTSRDEYFSQFLLETWIDEWENLSPKDKALRFMFWTVLEQLNDEDFDFVIPMLSVQLCIREKKWFMEGQYVWRRYGKFAFLSFLEVWHGAKEVFQVVTMDEYPQAKTVKDVLDSRENKDEEGWVGNGRRKS